MRRGSGVKFIISADNDLLRLGSYAGMPIMRRWISCDAELLP
jgi:hypothetical protein